MWLQIAKSTANHAKILNSFSKLSIVNTYNARSITTNSSPVYFQATNTLFAEPLKKKKRIDPAIIRQREEKRKRRLEKFIRRLQKLAKQLKPIEENEIPLHVQDQIQQRTRKLPPKSMEEIAANRLLEKEWCHYMSREHKFELEYVNNLLQSQKKALDELKEESLDLWQSAISLESDLVPHEANGPVYTPSIKNYRIRDGEYIDITKKFEGE